MAGILVNWFDDVESSLKASSQKIIIFNSISYWQILWDYRVQLAFGIWSQFKTAEKGNDDISDTRGERISIPPICHLCVGGSCILTLMLGDWPGLEWLLLEPYGPLVHCVESPGVNIFTLHKKNTALDLFPSFS